MLKYCVCCKQVECQVVVVVVAIIIRKYFSVTTGCKHLYMIVSLEICLRKNVGNANCSSESMRDIHYSPSYNLDFDPSSSNILSALFQL